MNDMLHRVRLPGRHAPGQLDRNHRPFSRSSASGAEAPLPLEAVIPVKGILELRSGVMTPCERGNDPRSSVGLVTQRLPSGCSRK